MATRQTGVREGRNENIDDDTRARAMAFVNGLQDVNADKKSVDSSEGVGRAAVKAKPVEVSKPSAPSASSKSESRGSSVDRIPRGSDVAPQGGPRVRSDLAANLSAVGFGALGQAFRAGKYAMSSKPKEAAAPTFKQANEALSSRMGAAVEGAKKATARRASEQPAAMKQGNEQLKSRMSSAVEGAKKATAPKLTSTQKAEEAARARFNAPGSTKKATPVKKKTTKAK